MLPSGPHPWCGSAIADGRLSLLPGLFLAFLRCRRLGGILLGDLAADDFAVEREGLQDDVEAAAVLVWERETKV